MLTYIKTCGEFRTDLHLYPFTFQGWSRAQIEAALDQLASAGLVELSVGLGEVPFVVAHLKHPEGQDGR